MGPPCDTLALHSRTPSRGIRLPMIRNIGRSIRRLIKRPGLTVTAVATLALAIGANTAIYSLLDTVALRPLPYREADRLILLGSSVTGLKTLRPLSWPKYQTIA